LGTEGEGTVVCVVDFETALIAVGALHTADNASLWLAANTPEIPPVGTPCTLVIQAAGPDIIEIELAADGTMWVDGRPKTAQELAKLIRAQKKGDPKQPPVVLVVGPKVSDKVVKAGVDALVAAGIARESLKIRKRAAKEPDPNP
jgi:biopolymer transport protein ExbD